MKVLIINKNIGTGSVGKICEELYFGLKNSGHECKVAYGVINKSRIPDCDLFRFGDPISLRKNALMARIFDNDGFGAKQETKKLLRFVSDYSPDLIHIHGCYGYYINLEMLINYAKTNGIYLVVTLHSCWDFTGHCCYFTKIGCEKWKKECCHCPGKNSYPSSLVFDNSRKNFFAKKRLFESLNRLTVVAPSRWMAALLGQSFLKDARIEVIKNGIDLDRFKPTNCDLKKYGIASDKKIILGVASVWDARKGLDDFIELAKCINEDYQIVLVGANDRRISRLAPNVISIRKTESKDELAALYSSASVLFNPTYEDNYPTVNIESIACGTPVVTYDTGGSPEAVEDLKCGKVILKKDYASLLAFVDNVAAKQRLDIEKISELSNRFMTEKYIDLFEKALAE